MTDFIPLDSAKIQANLALAPEVDFAIFDTLDSTNRYIKSHAMGHARYVCCLAESQTHGRGRRGRHWHSAHGQNIYFSLKLPLEGKLSAFSGLSLVASLAVLQVLSAHTDARLQLKWPNDVLVENKKISGVIIEATKETTGLQYLIIGIGININETFQGTNKPWHSLKDLTHKAFDRNRIVAELISTLHTYLEVFKAQGFEAFQPTWNELDCLKNKTIEVIQPNETIKGTALGTNHLGYLRLKDKKGDIHTLSVGDTTIKK